MRGYEVMEEVGQWAAQPLAVGPAIVRQQRKILKISFSPRHDHRRPQRVAIMQVQPSNSIEHIGSLEEETSCQPPSPPADADLSNYLSPIRADALHLLRPNAGPIYVLCFAVAGALALGFGLG